MNRGKLLLITIAASLGGLLFGYDTGVINGTQFYFTKFFDLSVVQQGWVVSSALVGCFFGAILAGPLSIFTGRKNSLILSAILFSLSAWGSGLPDFLPQTSEMLVFFRILGGLGIGIASMNAPMFIAELSPANIRGRMVTYYQLAIVIGFFVVFLATYFIGQTGDEIYNETRGWRLMFWSELIPCLLFLALMFFVPKSPRWLLMKGRSEEAQKVLISIHGQANAEEEMKEISRSINSESKSGLKDILVKGVFAVVLIGTALSVLQQLTGINAVLYYGADIFEKALGFDSEDVLKQQILLATVNLIFTFIAMYTVDRFGRKPLIYWGCAGMIIGFLLLGISLKTNSVGLVSLIGVLVFIGSFALSMGPVVWVLLAEVFPNKIRSVAMAIAVAAQWGMNGLVTFSFPVVMGSELNASATWNGSLPYFIFIFFILIIVLLTYKFVPETKGKSLEEIEEIWKSKA